MAVDVMKLPIDHLSVEQRLDLIGRLWDSLNETPSQMPITLEQKSEIERRLARDKRDPMQGIPWEAVFNGALSRTR